MHKVLTSFLLTLCLLPLCGQAQGRGWHGDIRHFDHHDVHLWRGGYWHNGLHDGRLGWWWVVGGVWYFYPQPVYPYPDPYQPPVVVQPNIPAPMTSPPAPTAQAAPQAATQNWYYCGSSKSYYPYVANCPEPWQLVPAKPPGVPQ